LYDAGCSESIGKLDLFPVDRNDPSGSERWSGDGIPEKPWAKISVNVNRNRYNGAGNLVGRHRVVPLHFSASAREFFMGYNSTRDG
jgi:hypothetical protein